MNYSHSLHLLMNDQRLTQETFTNCKLMMLRVVAFPLVKYIFISLFSASSLHFKKHELTMYPR